MSEAGASAILRYNAEHCNERGNLDSRLRGNDKNRVERLQKKMQVDFSSCNFLFYKKEKFIILFIALNKLLMIWSGRLV